MVVLSAWAMPRRGRGQALVELLVFCLALIPLVILVPWLARVQDLAWHSAAASRYAAFEGHVRHSSAWGSWKSNEELGREVRRRFFSASEALVLTGEEARDQAGHRNTAWNGANGENAIQRFGEQVSVRGTQRIARQPAGAWFAADLSLPQDNLHRSSVTLKPDLPGAEHLWSDLDLEMRFTTVVLLDSWSVRDGDRIAQKIRDARAAFPSQVGIEPVAAVHKSLLTVMFEREQPRAGLVRPDVIPADRLQEVR